MTASNLNPNTRIIRTHEEGFFTASGRTCDSCGLRARCEVPRGEVPPRMVCGNFSPLLVFAPPLIGFDGWFNTFRLGENTFRRYREKVGTVMTLYDKRKTGTILGHARITGVATGGFEDLLQRYAHTNHQCIGYGIKKEDAADFLRPVLSKAYGGFMKTDNPATEPFSVIFAVRCAEPKSKKPVIHGARRENSEAA